MDAILLALLPALAQPAEAALPVVTVSARKREESVVEVPAAITVFSAREIGMHGLRGFADYASKVPGMSFAYGNGTSPGETGTGIANARTIGMRGVAGTRTTGYYLDDTPLPQALDVRVLDVRAIEVLKGPQGTLFGEGSLGGNVRLLSNAPDLRRAEYRYGAEAGRTRHAGSANAGASAMANVVLREEAAALRLVAFAERQGGYLERDYRADIADPASPHVVVDDQAALLNRGASLSLLLRAAPAFDLSARLLHQQMRYKGMPAAYAPLPAFRPLRRIDHTADIQPRAHDRWTLPVLALDYRGRGWKLHSSTSYFMRQTLDVEDSTEGTAQYIAGYRLGTPPPQPFEWTATRRMRQLAHETRVAFAPAGTLSGIAGVYFSRRRNLRDTPPVYGRDVLGRPGRTMLWVYRNHYEEVDKSLFGELYAKLPRHFTLTVGLRKYWLRQANDGGFDGALYGVPVHSRTRNQADGASPKLALAWQPAPQASLYASAAKGFRAGGAQTDLSPLLGGCVTAEEARRLASVSPDTVWSYEAGGKLNLADPALLLTGAVYRIDWRQIQQPAFVPGCFFYLLGNAGKARINGAEVELTGRLAPGLGVRLGLGYQDARITEQGSSRQKAGERIRQVPELTATLGANYTRELRPGLRGFASADWSHVGNSVSANATTRPLLRPSYRLLNLRAGVAWGSSELVLEVRNAGNARPNLGDLGYLGYQRFDAATGNPVPQVATLPPRTFNVQLRRDF